MSDFDIKRVVYLENGARQILASEETGRKATECIDAEKELAACDLLQEDITQEIAYLKSSRDQNVGTMMQKMADLDQMIEYRKADLERNEYEKPIPEDPKELLRMKNSEDEKVQKEYSDFKTKIDIVLKRVGQDDPKTGNLLDRYIANTKLCEDTEKDLKMKNNGSFLPEDYNSMKTLMDSQMETDEMKQKVLGELETLSGEEDFWNKMKELKKNLETEQDVITESETQKKVIENEKKTLQEEIDLVKSGAYPNDKRKDLLQIEEINAYLSEEALIDQKKRLLEKEEQLDALKIPDTFTQLGALTPEERRDAENKINALLEREAKFSKEEKPVKSVQEYYDGLKQAVAMKDRISRNTPYLPDDDNLLGAFVSMPTVTIKYPRLSEASGHVLAAEKNLEMAEEAFLEEEVNCSELPDTMTKLKELKKKDARKYKYVKAKVDQLIKTLSIPGVNVLEDYFVLAEREEKAAKEKKTDVFTELKNRQNGELSAAAIKSRIKEKIAQRNKELFKNRKFWQTKKSIEPTKEYENRKNILEAARTELKNQQEKARNLIKDLNRNIDKERKTAEAEQEAFEKKIAAMKAYIKNTVKAEKQSIQNTRKMDEDALKELEKEHSKKKDAFRKAVDTYYAKYLAGCDAGIKASQQRIDKAKDKIPKLKKDFEKFESDVFQKAKENNKKVKKSHDHIEMQQTWEKLDKARKQLEEDGKQLSKYFATYNSTQQGYIKKELKTLNLSFGQDHNDYVNSTILKNIQDQKSSAKWQYYWTVVTSKGMGLASDVISVAAEKLQSCVKTLGEAQINGEIQTIKDQIMDLSNKKNRYSTVNAQERAELYHQQSFGSITEEQGRNIIDGKKQLRSDQKEIDNISQEIIKLQKKADELEKNKPKRIQEFEEKIRKPEKTGDAENTGDREVLVKKAALRSKLVNEVAPEDQVSNRIAEVNEQLEKDHKEALDALDEKEKAACEKRESRIKAAGDKLGKLYTENAMGKIDTAIDVTILVVDIIKTMLSKEESAEDSKEEAKKDSEESKEESKENSEETSKETSEEASKEASKETSDKTAESQEKSNETSGKSDAEAESDEDSNDISRDSMVASFKEFLDKIPDFKNEDKKDPHFIQQITELFPELLTKINNLSAYMIQKAEGAEKDRKINERLYHMLEADEADYVDYLAKKNEMQNDSKEMSKEDQTTEQEKSPLQEENLLEYEKNKLNQRIEEIEEGTEREVNLCDQLAGQLVDKKQQAEQKLADKQKEKINAEEKEKQGQESLTEQRRGLIREFSVTLKQGEKKEHKKPILTVEDIMSDSQEGMDGLRFLGKLTGNVYPDNEFRKGMPIMDAMRKLEKVYINGINAVTYFGLEQDFKKAIAEDIKLENKDQSDLTKALMQRVNTCGLDLQMGLRYVVTKDEKQKASLGKNALAGQLIAVEDEHMFLNSVQITSPEIESYQMNLKVPVKPSGNGKDEIQAYENAKHTYDANLQIYKDNKAIMDYSRSNGKMYEEFNAMRQEVAGYELGRSISKEPGLTKPIEKQKVDKKEKLSAAVYGGKGL